MTWYHESSRIIERMQDLARVIKRLNIDDPNESIVIEYRQLLCRLWQVPLRWELMQQDPEAAAIRRRPRGTRAEHCAIRLMFGR